MNTIKISLAKLFDVKSDKHALDQLYKKCIDTASPKDAILIKRALKKMDRRKKYGVLLSTAEILNVNPTNLATIANL